MRTLAKTFILLGLCGGVSAGAMRLSPVSHPLSQASTSGGHSPASPARPVLAGFHHGSAHHHVVIIDGGFWWGYPYPYYYGYPASYYGGSFEKVGKVWGKDLKHGTVTMEQFVTFLRLDVVKASDAARSHFQVGFLKGYGKNGLSVFTQALSEATEHPSGPGAAVPPPAPAQPKADTPPGKAPLMAPKYQ